MASRTTDATAAPAAAAAPAPGSAPGQAPDTVIFDLGGVLLDWNPRYLYRQLFEDPAEMEGFLARICTSESTSGKTPSGPASASPGGTRPTGT